MGTEYFFLARYSLRSSCSFMDWLGFCDVTGKFANQTKFSALPAHFTNIFFASNNTLCMINNKYAHMAPFLLLFIPKFTCVTLWPLSMS